MCLPLRCQSLSMTISYLTHSSSFSHFRSGVVEALSEQGQRRLLTALEETLRPGTAAEGMGKGAGKGAAGNSSTPSPASCVIALEGTELMLSNVLHFESFLERLIKPLLSGAVFGEFGINLLPHFPHSQASRSCWGPSASCPRRRSDRCRPRSGSTPPRPPPQCDIRRRRCGMFVRTGLSKNAL